MRINDIKRLFDHMLGPIKIRILLMIGRGVLTAIDSSKEIQLAKLTLLADETKDQTEIFQHFGFRSSIPKDSDLIFLSIGGNRDHGVIIGSESRSHAIKGLNEGDTVIYNKNGKYLWLKGENLEGIVEKIEINNSSHELISVLVEYFEKSRDAKNLTALGPMPKDPADVTLLTEAIDKLKTFKV